MTPIHLAILWHQHQPYYPDDISGDIPFPWVRLHGTKDYVGMALHLKEVPEFHCTINLVPSLLRQIQQFVDGRQDQHLILSRRPADALAATDVTYLLDHFFMANVDQMIRPYPRYYELYQKRGVVSDSAENAAHRFREHDLRDLQVWSNLTWIHELVFEQDPDLAEFRRKGERWSENDKTWLLAKQRDILASIIPLHKELAERGQVELTTTPFFHPILPLLWNKRSAHQSLPGCPLPNALDSYADDAQIHIERAITYHRELFGVAPNGMWPSEGSVSEDILPTLASAGIQWIATDEEILFHSTNGQVCREGQGHLRNPERLYQAWQTPGGNNHPKILFRDHVLSDLIGFHYQRSDPQHAAADLISRIEAIGKSTASRRASQIPLVPIILDGENCWEYYPNGGVDFLRAFYRGAAKHSAIRPVTVSEHLNAVPTTETLPALRAGSWINHNFAIWIGHREDNTAWDRLHETRAFLKRAIDANRVPTEAAAKAWEEIYIAEGSDWFWWYGDDHSSDQDGLFDAMFHRHLQNVYRICGAEPPASLYQPISSTAPRVMHSQPTGFLPVRIDGRQTYFEWQAAGRYVSGSDRGTMTLVTEGLIRSIAFGFDPENFYLRVDTAGKSKDDLTTLTELRIPFSAPEDVVASIDGLPNKDSWATLTFPEEKVEAVDLSVANEEILELCIPLVSLRVSPGEPLHFAVEALTDNASIDRLPREGWITLTTPTPDFERELWQV